jgi:branched-chain amino acid transport system permease protein
VNAQFDVVNQIILFAILAVSLNLMMGVGGQASLAPAAFGAVGGYSIALLGVHTGIPFVLSLPAAVVVSALIGVLVALPALRLSSEYLILLTLAFSYVVLAVAGSVTGLGGQFGLLDVPQMKLGGWILTTPARRFPFLFVVLALVMVVAWRVSHSAFGRALRALREEEEAVRSLGLSTVRLKIALFGISSAIAGLAGALFVSYDRLASPPQFSLSVSITVVIMMVLGGSGSLWGPVVGAALIQLLSPALEDIVRLAPGTAQNVQLVLYGAALVVIMLFRPQGLIAERAGHEGGHVTRCLRGLTGTPRSVAATADGRRVAKPITTARRAPTSSGELVASGLNKSFGGLAAASDLDFVLPAGQVTALIGPNGAGKSTLFALLTGALKPDSGAVRLRGVDLVGKSPTQTARLGVVRSFQDVRLFRRLTVLDNVLVAVPDQTGESLLSLFLRPRVVKRDDRRCRSDALEHLRRVGLESRAEVVAGDLSYAEQKLVAIARTLATGAEVLLLDEPTSGVDPAWLSTIAEVIRRLPEQGRTVCLVEHNLSFLAMVGAPCFFMESGHIVTSGDLATLMGQPHLRSSYFGEASLAGRVSS